MGAKLSFFSELSNIFSVKVHCKLILLHFFYHFLLGIERFSRVFDHVQGNCVLAGRKFSKKNHIILAILQKYYVSLQAR